MTEEVAKIKANKDGTYIDIVPEKCVNAQKAQYDESGRDLLDAESSQTIKGANTFAAKQTFTGGVAVSGTSAIAGNVNMDSGDLAIGAKVTASNTGNSLKVANHDTALMSNDVLSAKDINTPNGDANSLVHRSGDEPIVGQKTLLSEPVRQSVDWATYQCRATSDNSVQTTIPSSNITIGGIGFTDKNGAPLGGITFNRNTDAIVILAYAYDNKGGWHGTELFRVEYQ